MDFRSEGTTKRVNLSTLLLRSLKAERCDLFFLGGRGVAPALEPFQNMDSSLVLLLLSFKIAQKTAFEAKRRRYTTGNVIQRLFNIDFYTHLAIYRYR